MAEEFYIPRIIPVSFSGSIEWSDNGQLALCNGGKILILTPKIYPLCTLNEEFGLKNKRKAYYETSTEQLENNEKLALWKKNYAEDGFETHYMLANLVEYDTFTKAFWSPKCDDTYDCYLAGITDRNQVCVYTSIGNSALFEWKMLFTTTTEIIKLLNISIENEIKDIRLLRSLSIFSMAWAPRIKFSKNNNIFISLFPKQLLATASGNGEIIFWSIYNGNYTNESTVSIIDPCNCDLILDIKWSNWIEITPFSLFSKIACVTSSGKIFILNIEYSLENLTFNQFHSYEICSDYDYIPSSCISWYNYQVSINNVYHSVLLVARSHVLTMHIFNDENLRQNKFETYYLQHDISESVSGLEISKVAEEEFEVSLVSSLGNCLTATWTTKFGFSIKKKTNDKQISKSFSVELSIVKRRNRWLVNHISECDNAQMDIFGTSEMNVFSDQIIKDKVISIAYSIFPDKTIRYPIASKSWLRIYNYFTKIDSVSPIVLLFNKNSDELKTKGAKMSVPIYNLVFPLVGKSPLCFMFWLSHVFENGKFSKSALKTILNNIINSCRDCAEIGKNKISLSNKKHMNLNSIENCKDYLIYELIKAADSIARIYYFDLSFFALPINDNKDETLETHFLPIQLEILSKLSGTILYMVYCTLKNEPDLLLDFSDTYSQHLLFNYLHLYISLPYFQSTTYNDSSLPLSIPKLSSEELDVIRSIVKFMVNILNYDLSDLKNLLEARLSSNDSDLVDLVSASGNSFQCGGLCNPLTGLKYEYFSLNDDGEPNGKTLFEASTKDGFLWRRCALTLLPISDIAQRQTSFEPLSNLCVYIDKDSLGDISNEKTDFFNLIYTTLSTMCIYTGFPIVIKSKVF